MLERLTVGPIAENTYVIAEGSCCILVDPGGEARRLLSFLDSRALVPSMIVATHGHLDHTAAIPELLSAWGARGIDVPLAVHAEDSAYFGPASEATNKKLFASIGALGFFNAYWRPIPSPQLLLSDGDLLPCAFFRVIHTPGHSRGSICLYDSSSSILVSGDTLFHDGRGRSDGPDADDTALRASLKRLFELPPSTRVFPGHGDETTIERESGSIDGL